MCNSGSTPAWYLINMDTKINNYKRIIAICIKSSHMYNVCTLNINSPVSSCLNWETCTLQKWPFCLTWDLLWQQFCKSWLGGCGRWALDLYTQTSQGFLVLSNPLLLKQPFSPRPLLQNFASYSICFHIFRLSVSALTHQPFNCCPAPLGGFLEPFSLRVDLPTRHLPSWKKSNNSGEQTETTPKNVHPFPPILLCCAWHTQTIPTCWNWLLSRASREHF